MLCRHVSSIAKQNSPWREPALVPSQPLVPVMAFSHHFRDKWHPTPPCLFTSVRCNRTLSGRGLGHLNEQMAVDCDCDLAASTCCCDSTTVVETARHFDRRPRSARVPHSAPHWHIIGTPPCRNVMARCPPRLAPSHQCGTYSGTQVATFRISPSFKPSVACEGGRSKRSTVETDFSFLNIHSISRRLMAGRLQRGMKSFCY